MTDDRATIVLRLPKSLLAEYERRAKKQRKSLGASWSRNDEIVSTLASAEPNPNED